MFAMFIFMHFQFPSLFFSPVLYACWSVKISVSVSTLVVFLMRVLCLGRDVLGLDNYPVRIVQVCPSWPRHS